jgi:integration host factor subunit beta
MQTITKRDLIDRVAQATGQRRADVKRTISAFLDLMVDELAGGNRIEFREFGVFETKERAARTAQNPKTLERVIVPPRRTVKFKAGRQVRDRLETSRPEATSTEVLPQTRRRPASAKAQSNGMARPQSNGVAKAPVNGVRIEVKPANHAAV